MSYCSGFLLARAILLLNAPAKRGEPVIVPVADGHGVGHYTQKEANSKFKIPLFCDLISILITILEF